MKPARIILTLLCSCLAWLQTGICPLRCAEAEKISKQAISCDNTQGWAVVSTQDGTMHNNQMNVTDRSGTFVEGAGALEWHVQRRQGAFEALVSTSTVTDLASVSFDIWSEKPATIWVGIEDRDRAKFHYATRIEAGRWTQLKLRPSDFLLNDDSPVKKQTMDPKRLGIGFGLVDVSGLLGTPGDNTLRVDRVFVERSTLSLKGPEVPSVIEGRTIEVTQPTSCKGPITIRKGGILKISTARFDLQGNIKIEDGKLEVKQTNFNFLNRFPHEITISCCKNAVLSFDNCVCAGQFPATVDLFDHARLELKRTQFEGASLTTGCRDGCALVLDEVKGAGEFILQPGSTTTVRGSESVLLWYWPFGKTLLNLPNDKIIKRWSMPIGSTINVSISNSRSVQSALVWDAGSDVSVLDTNLRAIGIPVARPTRQLLAGIKNKQPVSAMKLQLEDRRLTMNNSTVEAWNIYAAQKADIVLEDSLFGEAMSSEEANMLIKNSTCDGTGGYIASKDKSTLRLSGCTLNCPAESLGASTLILENCHVNGPVVAAGHSKVRLLHSSVPSGGLRKLDQADVQEIR